MTGTATAYAIEEIEFGSPEVLSAWATGVEVYTPTLNGRKLQGEGGTTETSIANLRWIARKTGTKPDSVVMGPNENLLFFFPGHGPYLATGFGTGYLGQAPSGLAEITAEFGFGDRRQLREFILDTPRSFCGVLFHKSSS